jgi:hypothetical protein
MRGASGFAKERGDEARQEEKAHIRNPPWHPVAQRILDAWPGRQEEGTHVHQTNDAAFPALLAALLAAETLNGSRANPPAKGVHDENDFLFLFFDQG